MRRILSLLAILFCISSYSYARCSFRIGSYNLWISSIGKGDNTWELRKARLAQSIADMDFDIFGAQEVDTRIQDELPELIKSAGGGTYSWFIFSPYDKNGGKGDKAQAIIYRNDKFELLETHCFWFSNTPDIQSTGWDEMAYFRGACCALFRDRKCGTRFIVFNTHLPLGAEARAHASEIILAKAAEYNPDNLPAFLLGDMNAVADSRPSEILRSYWNDSYLELPYKKMEGPSGTFNAANLQRNMRAARRIDYIYYRGDVTVRKYVCSDRRYDGFYPSDHCPIYINLTIK